MTRLAMAGMLALALSAGAPIQEPATLSGRVTNAQGAPPSAATVTLVGTTFSATTDFDGRYRISGIPPRHYTMSVQSRDGSYVSRHVSLAPGQNATVNVVVGIRPGGSTVRQPR